MVLTNSITEEIYPFALEIGIDIVDIEDHEFLNRKSPESLQRSYETLRDWDIPISRIKSFYYIIGISQDVLQSNYEGLQELGFSEDKIKFHANLLVRNRDIVKDRFHKLRELGFSEDIIRQRTELLLIPTESVTDHYVKLERQGLTGKKNSTLAALLAMNPDNVIGNNLSHRRFVSGSLLETFTQLNGIPTATIEANIQFASFYGVGYDNGIFLGSHPRTKRKKLAWIMREVMNYGELEDAQEKKNYLKALRKFISDNPKYLRKGIPMLRKEKEEIALKLFPYVLASA